MIVKNSYIVAQLGGRMHYAVPRIMQQAGILQCLYTDINASNGWASFLRGLPLILQPVALRKMLGRIPVGVSDSRVSSFDLLGVAYALRLRLARSNADQTRTHLWANELFGKKIIAKGIGDASAIYTFNGAGLPLMRHAKNLGIHTVMEQTIAPLRFENLILSKEQARFPEWEDAPGHNPYLEELSQREESEWLLADTILCGSTFVVDGIRASNGPVDRCQVVPYGVDVSPYHTVKRRRRLEGPLRVLTVGTVGLRKGAPHVLAAAKAMGKRAIFRMVGPVAVKQKALTQLRAHIEVVRPVPRIEVISHYAWADVFLLPSLCEGSATVTYEALASGLPVICTPNTGSVVRDGSDGFIVAPHDPDQIIEKLELLTSDNDLLAYMSRNAQRSIDAISEESYATRLLEALAWV